MLTTLFLLGASKINPSAFTKASWKLFVSDEAKLSILLPEKPVVKKGHYDSLQFIQILSSSRDYCAVTVVIVTFNQPFDSKTGLENTKIFQNSVLTAANEIAPIGIPKNSKPELVTRSGIKGEQFLFEQLRIGVWGRVWSGYDQRRIFILMAGVTSDKERTKAKPESLAIVDKCFDSFKLSP